jgi:hypothetical protein
MAYRGVSAYARRVLSGPFALAAALLAVGGVMKMVRPGPAAGALAALHIPAALSAARLMGGAELIAGSAALVVGGRGAALVVAGFYLVFAAFVAMAISGRVEVASCGCFGQEDAPPTVAHLVIDLCAAGVCLVAAVAAPPSGIIEVLATQPWAGIPFIGFLILGVAALVMAMTELPRLNAARADR